MFHDERTSVGAAPSERASQRGEGARPTTTLLAEGYTHGLGIHFAASGQGHTQRGWQRNRARVNLDRRVDQKGSGPRRDEAVSVKVVAASCLRLIFAPSSGASMSDVGERPHEALGQDTPRSVFTRSSRRYPRPLVEFEIQPWADCRRVDRDGNIRWRDKRVFVSTALAHEDIRVDYDGEFEH